VLVTGTGAVAMADELRRHGKRAVADLAGLQGSVLTEYARRWGFTEVVRAGANKNARPKNPQK